MWKDRAVVSESYGWLGRNLIWLLSVSDSSGDDCCSGRELRRGTGNEAMAAGL